MFLCFQFGYSQDNTKVHEFRGGNVNFNLTYYMGFIYGIGSRNLNTNSSLRNYGAESIYWNPAGLAFMENSQVFVDYAPPIAVNPKSFVDFQKEVNKGVDEEFKSKKANDAIYSYPDLKTEFPSGSRIHSIAIAMPFNNFAVGLSYYNPFELKLDILESGFRAFFIDNENSPTEIQTAFRASGDLNGYFHLFSEAYALAMAYKFTDQFAAGITFEYYTVMAKAKADLNMYGSIARGYLGNFNPPVLFNDPTTLEDQNNPYSSNLFSTLNGKFSGNSWATKIGASYRIQDFGEVAFTANIPFTIHLDGNLDIVQSMPPFYTEGDIDEDAIDPNRTNETAQTYYHSNGMRIKLPGDVNLGYTHAFGSFSLIANIGYHFNEFSYDYSNTESYSDDSTAVNRQYINGMKMGADFRLGFDFGPVKLATGAILAEEVRDDDKSPSSFVIPVFSLAFGIPVMENLRVDANLLSLSMPLSRVTLSYLF